MRAVVALLLLPTQGLALRLQSSSCTCLNWKDVYATHDVRCGQGYEISMLGAKVDRGLLPTKVPSGMDMYDEFCTRFFMEANFNKCLNMKFMSPTQQWCYVSPECEGAEKVPGANAAIKMCGEGDDFMNATSPDELNRLATDSKLERGLFGKLSYALDSWKWSEIESASGLNDERLQLSHLMESFYGIKWTGRKPLVEAATNKMHDTKASNVPTIFDTDNGHGGGTLVWGSKIYGFLPKEGLEGLAYACLNC